MFTIFPLTCRVLRLASIIVIPAAAAFCQGFDVKGQLSSWGTAADQHGEWNGNYGIRYIPQFNYGYSPDDRSLINAEVLANAYYGTDFHTETHALTLSRAILRYTTPQTETQLVIDDIYKSLSTTIRFPLLAA